MTVSQPLESCAWGAKRLGVDIQRFYDLARTNFFPTGVIVRLGRQIRVNPELLEKFLASGGAPLAGGWRNVPLGNVQIAGTNSAL
jgi:hypothetical protein